MGWHWQYWKGKEEESSLPLSLSLFSGRDLRATFNLRRGEEDRSHTRDGRRRRRKRGKGTTTHDDDDDDDLALTAREREKEGLTNTFPSSFFVLSCACVRSMHMRRRRRSRSRRRPQGPTDRPQSMESLCIHTLYSTMPVPLRLSPAGATEGREMPFCLFLPPSSQDLFPPFSFFPPLSLAVGFRSQLARERNFSGPSFPLSLILFSSLSLLFPLACALSESHYDCAGEFRIKLFFLSSDASVVVAAVCAMRHCYCCSSFGEVAPPSAAVVLCMHKLMPALLLFLFSAHDPKLKQNFTNGMLNLLVCRRIP